MWILKWLSDIAVVKQQEQQEFLLRSFPYGVCCISFYCFCFCFNQAGVYDSNNVIQISNYYNWPWWWVSLAFTTVCLIPEDGQLSHNAHFIEIIVLIMALRIHHFVSICRPVCGNTTFRRSEMWKLRGSSSDTVVAFLSLSSGLGFWKTWFFLRVKRGSSLGEQPQGDKV